mgnify:CR=1 FL=1
MCPLSLSLSLSLSLPRCSLTMHSLAQQQWISQCGLTGEFEPTSEAVLHSVWVKKLFTLFTQSYDFLKNLAMEEPMFFGQFAEVRRMRSPMALTTAPASHRSRSRSLRPPCPIKRSFARAPRATSNKWSTFTEAERHRRQRARPRRRAHSKQESLRAVPSCQPSLSPRRYAQRRTLVFGSSECDSHVSHTGRRRRSVPS